MKCEAAGVGWRGGGGCGVATGYREVGLGRCSVDATAEMHVCSLMVLLLLWSADRFLEGVPVAMLSLTIGRQVIKMHHCSHDLVKSCPPL
jgi:hypothetical protein